MNGPKSIIEALQQNSNLLDLIKSGLPPDQIKRRIIKTFNPFFENKQNLEKYSTTNLVSDMILYSKYEDDDWFNYNLIDSLNLYRSSRNSNYLNCNLIFKNLIEMQLKTGNQFWSFVLLERSKKDLEILEFTHEVMNDIGKIVEGLSKINLLEYLSMYRVSKGKTVNMDDVIRLDLGVICNELSQSKYGDIFIVNNLRLSNWRNIAYHHNYSIHKGKIQCKYGPTNNRKLIELTRLELWEVLVGISKRLDLLNLTHKLHFYDYEQEILENLDAKIVERDIRPEIWFLTLASAITAQGFEIIDFETKEELTKIVLREATPNPDTRIRAIHSSQFVYNLWYYSSSKYLEVEYRQANNKVYLIASSTSEICKKIGDGEESLSYLAEHINLDIVGENS